MPYLIIAALVVWLIIQIGKWLISLWPAFVIAGVVWLAYALIKWVQKEGNETAIKDVNVDQQKRYGFATGSITTAPDTPIKESDDGMRMRRLAELDLIYGAKKSSFKPTNIRWVGAGETLTLHGFVIRSGLIYVADSFKGQSSNNRPEIVALDEAVYERGDNSPLTGYYPYYSGMTAQQRNTYLKWVANGRRDPEANIGFVFLYFYGLEYRLLKDENKEAINTIEAKAIFEEVAALLRVYGEKSGSVQRYLSSFLAYFAIHPTYGKLLPASDDSTAERLFTSVKLKLGELVKLKQPIPAELALSWVMSDGNFSKRTAVKRCTDVFKKAFLANYENYFAKGFTVTANATKIKNTYIPASAELMSGGPISSPITDLPDITVLTKPREKLQALVDQCTGQIDAYSKSLAKGDVPHDSIDALINLDPALWPDSRMKTIKAIHTIVQQSKNGIYEISQQKLMESFGNVKALTAEKSRKMGLALYHVGVGIEPNISVTGKWPESDEKVFLFSVPAGSTGIGNEFALSSLSIELAAMVSAADGSVDESEINHLHEQITAWSHVNAEERLRLSVAVKRLCAAPPSMASMRSKVAKIEGKARETVGLFLARVAAADGHVSPKEVQLLEKIYGLLSLDTQLLYAALHAGDTPAPNKGAAGPASTVGTKKSGVDIDPQRLAALKADTKRVSALLTEVFAEKDEVHEAPVEAVVEEVDTSNVGDTLLGLNTDLTAFLRQLMTQQQWEREELSAVAQDFDLMLDGALERINEAALDQFDEVLCEEDGAIMLNAAVVHAIDKLTRENEIA